MSIGTVVTINEDMVSGINGAQTLTENRFGTAESYASSAVADAKTQMASLQAAAANLDPPLTNITYTAPSTDPGWTGISTTAPSVALNGAIPAKPVDTVLETFLASVDFSGLTVPEIPAYTTSVPYAKLLLKVEDDIVNGTTGLDPTVEQAIWDRAETRRNAEAAAAYDKINDSFGLYGLDLPSGALASALLQVTNQNTINANDTNNQIIIEQAKLAQNNMQFALDLAFKIEAQAQEFHQVAVTLAVNVAKANIILATAHDDSIQKRNTLSIEKYKVQLNAWVSDVDRVTRDLTVQLDKYRNDIAAYATENEGEKSLYDIKVRAQANTVNYAVENIRLLFSNAQAEKTNYIALQTLNIEAAKGIATASASMAASAMNAVNASASVTYSGSESNSEAWGHTENLGETHSF